MPSDTLFFGQSRTPLLGVCLLGLLLIPGCHSREGASASHSGDLVIERETVKTNAPSAQTAPAAPVEKPFVPAVTELTNSLGMVFVHVPGTRSLFNIHETRVKDYRAFVHATKRAWPAPGFRQGDTHPAVNVSWEDATMFCQWLTEKERAEGRLKPGWRYRLPRDEEWSVAVGLQEALTHQTRPRDLAEPGTYPWGGSWPPPRQAGNYGAELAVENFPHTAPVGSFAPNQRGLYDLGGNVWEWCEDKYEESEDYRVLRGASWRMRNPGDLLSSYRVGNASDLRLGTYGFRAVLELEPDSMPAPAGGK
ncbi:MAG: SUMF1/EgtB/PvdO family nonheme iron enzyme [Verrucomicrobiae bacterium]|nr:SUMF1/EgtB/PvdO family nonheme iron enzyme [Verrucomicrobiae bacterium]